MRRIVSLSLAALFLLCSCAAEPARLSFYAMDTLMVITAYGDASGAMELVGSLEGSLSVTDSDSDIYRLNRDKRAVLPKDAAELLAGALELCEATGGALDVTVYPAVRAWGFTTGEHRVPSGEELDAILGEISYKRVRLDGSEVSIGENMLVDLGAVAKGYAGDRLAKLLRENGVESAIMSLGGSVQCVGSRPNGSPWRVAIQDPEGTGTIGAVLVSDAAVVTSGGYERYFEENGEVYWHIMDPASASPARSGLISATVIGPSGLVCDGLSTAFFVAGMDRSLEMLQAFEGYGAIFVAEDGALYVTAGLEAIFSPAEGRTVEVIGGA